MTERPPRSGGRAVIPWVVGGTSEHEVRAHARSLLTATAAGPEGFDAAGVGAELASRLDGGHDDRHRAVVLSASWEGLRDGLAAVADGSSHVDVTRGTVPPGPAPWVGFAFPGHGCQWPGMALELEREEPQFQDALAELAATVEANGGPDVAAWLRSGDADPGHRRVDVVQPVLFAVESALASLWQTFGVVPDAVIGHSMGEVGAMLVAGGASPDGAATVAVGWSAAQARIAGVGEMAGVGLSVARAEELVRSWGDERIVVSGDIAPESVLLSGPAGTLSSRLPELVDRGVAARMIDVDLGPHGPGAFAVHGRTTTELAGFTPVVGRIPFYSSAVGGRLDTSNLTPQYWADNFTTSIDFRSAIGGCVRDGHGLLIEVGPHPVLSGAMEQVVTETGTGAAVVPTLRRDRGGLRRFLESVARAWTCGADVDWRAAFSETPAGPSVLPPQGAAGACEPVAAGASKLADGGDGDVSDSAAAIEAVVVAESTALLGLTSPLDPTGRFVEAGFDSALLVELRDRLSAVVRRPIPIATLFGHPSPRELAVALSGGTPTDAARAGRDATTSSPQAAADLAGSDAVAVVGMACRLPGDIDDPDRLWDLLVAEGDATGDLPSDRGWDLAALTDPDRAGAGATVQRRGGFIADVGAFDPEFFHMSPREALAAEPQQRVLLELAWQALENGRIPPTSIRGTSAGVFLGVIGQEYGPSMSQGNEEVAGHLFTGTTPSVASGRLAYVLDLRGPALSLDTACSSSLVAIELARRSLLQGETTLALAGGATVMSKPGMLVDFSRQGVLAPDGRCKSFGADADGFGMAEGGGVLVLERLSDARRQGHPVLAVLRGGSLNQDGASNGLSAPNGVAQREVIEEALQRSGVQPSDVDVVEAHGTGTRLGDPIEAQALIESYGAGREGRAPLLVGSVKSNLGHTQAAAGVVGVIKMVLALQREYLPRSVIDGPPSTEIEWGDRLELLTEARRWARGPVPRRAGVSSFGISGTNVHLVLEEAAPEGGTAGHAGAEPGGPVPVVLSGAGEEGLRTQAARLAAHLRRTPSTGVAEIGHALTTTRAALSHRAVLVADSRNDLLGALERVADGPCSGDATVVHDAGRGTTAPVFVFPGQGWQWDGMAAALLETSPVFADAMAACDQALAPHTGMSVLEEIRCGDPTPESVERVQPVLFATMVSLAALWRAHGVEPGAVVGHSQGEIAAAHVADALTLEEAARLVAVRSGLLRELRGFGAMVSVAADVATVTARLGDEAVVAVVNGPRSVVVAGPGPELDWLVAGCEADGIRTHRLAVDYPSHGPTVERIRDSLLRELGDVERRTPKVPFFSTVRGRWVSGPELDARYWYDNLRDPVRFDTAVRELAADDHTVFVELSLHPVLTTAVDEIREGNGLPGPAAFSSLRRDHASLDDFHVALAHVHAAGSPVDWRDLWTRHRPAPVDLPVYEFRRERTWWEPTPSAEGPRGVRHGLEHGIEWRPRPGSASGRPAGTWAVVRDLATDPAVAGAVHAALEAVGAEAVDVEFGPPAVDRTRAVRWLRAAGDPGGWSGTISLLALDGDHGDDPSPLSPRSMPGLGGSIALLQALVEIDARGRLWFLTRGAVSTGPTEDVDPPSAALWGLGRVAALEHPALWGGLVDVSAAAPDEIRDYLADVVGGGGSPSEDQIALRGDRVLVRRWTTRPATTGLPDWSPRGTVLVTGGTGGLGRRLVRWLAGLGVPHILVLGRRGPQAPDADALTAEVAAAGSSVSIVACDVTDRDALARVFETHDGPPVDAIVHTAGTLEDATLENLDGNQVHRACRAKVDGARNLDELTSDRELSAFVLFSSLAAALGAPGMGAYAPGNTYLDALAARRRSRGLPATSVAWGTWDGAGMAEGAAGKRLSRHGIRPLSTEDALRALHHAIGGDDPAPAVIDIDWSRFVPAFTSRRATPLFDNVPEARRHRVESGGGWASTVAHLPAGERAAAVVALVRTHVAEVLGYDDAGRVPPHRAFRELGFDSLAVVDLRNRLRAVTGLSLPATVVIDYPDVQRLAEFVVARLPGAAEEPETPAPVDRSAPEPREPMAIVGMACRFPGGIDGPDSFWAFLDRGGDSAQEVGDDRGWSTERIADAAGSALGDRPWGHFLADAGGFDAEFFGISPREALAMDPQQRQVLEVAWETLEHAGIAPGSLRGSDTGVFVGATHQGYATDAVDRGDEVGGYVLTGNTASVVSGRVSYVLGLEGPAVTVDTACSSSLVALHWACEALRSGECTMALAGGVTVSAGREVFTEFARQGALAPDGRCKSFSDDADGFGVSEGAALVLLEPLSRARARGHRVWAAVSGSATNQDGASNGLSAPSGSAQERVIRRAWSRAGISGAQVDVVEGHGTGTRLGDPVEAFALAATYGRLRDRDEPLWLGSVKSNIGHTQAAAGAAGVIKMALALHHRQLPASPCVGRPTKMVDWTEQGVRVLTEPRSWTDGRHDGVRRAGVSAFGVSGTNAHLILEEPPFAVDEPEETLVGTGTFPIVVSARTPEALRRQASRVADVLADAPPDRLERVATALLHGRTHWRWRAGGAAGSVEEAVDLLRRLAASDGEPTGAEDPWRPGALVADAGPDAVGLGTPGRDAVWVFPGQGSQWDGMARELLAGCDVFADALAECDRVIAPLAGWSVREVVDGGPGAPSLSRVEVVQPVLFAVMVSLARVWQHAGARPAAVIGHSQGEIAAAVVAGALSLEEGAEVVVTRSRLLRDICGGGTMLAVATSEERIRGLLGTIRGAHIAAVNGSCALTVAGDHEAVTRVEERCTAAGIRTQRLGVDYAAHSPQVESILDAIGRELPEPAASPVTSFYSTVTGSWYEQPLTAGYWARNLREPVRFDAAVRAATKDGHTAFLEISAHPTLTPAIAAEHPPVVVHPTLHRDHGSPDALLRSVVSAHVHRVALAWGEPTPEAQAVLPPYPFQHEHYWLELSGPTASDDLHDRFYMVDWRRTDAQGPTGWDGEFVVVSPWRPRDADRIGRWRDLLSAEIASRGGRVQHVTLDPASPEPEPESETTTVISLAGLDTPDDGGMAVGLAVLHRHVTAASVWLLTSGAVAVEAADEVVDPAEGRLWGLAVTAALERRSRTTGIADVPPIPDEATCAALVAAFGGREDQIAIRRGVVHARRLCRVRRPAGDAGPVPETVLVTGGTTGLGAAAARHLADRGARHLALVSRRGRDVEGIDALVVGLERNGATVSVHAADVTDGDQVAALSAKLDAAGHPVRGVVHAAGVQAKLPLDELSAEEAATVAAPKVLGVRTLDACWPDVGMFVTFSSGAGVWGSGGQSAYAAANADLDAFAHWRRARGRHALSVAWGLCDDGGMTDDASRADLGARGLVAMSSRSVFDALDRALAADDTTLVVAGVDWPMFAVGYTADGGRPLLDKIPQARPASAPEPDTGGSSWVEKLAARPPAERRHELGVLVRGQVADVLGFAGPAAVDTATTLSGLGVDSLAAVRLSRRLAEATGLALASTVAFDHPSAGALADHLDAELRSDRTEVDLDAAIDAIEVSLPGVEPETRARLLSRLDALTADPLSPPHPARTSAPGDDDLAGAGIDELLGALGRELGDDQ